MAGPITWRNVIGPSLADASAPLQAAQRSFDGSFNILNQALAQRQAANQFVQTRQEDAAKQGFLNTVQGAKTVEELQALQSSGQLAQMLQGLTPEAQAAVRGADERRIGDLRDFATRELKFSAEQQQATDAAKAREAQPIVDRLRTLAASADPEARASSQAALDVYSANGMVPNSGKLMTDLVGSDRAAVKHGFDVNDEGRRANEDKRSQTRLEDSLETNAAQRAASQENLEFTREQRNEAKAGRQAEGRFFEQAEAHKQNVLKLGQQQGEIARKAGLPTVNGMPDYTAIEADPQKKSLFDRSIAKFGLQIPSDTEANNAAIESLRAQGVNGSTLAKLRAQGNAFSTSPESLLVGEDAAALKRTQAAIDKKQGEVEKSNSLFVSTNNVLDQMPALLKQLKDSGVDDEGARIVQSEVMKSLKFDPDTPLHIPAIVSAAATSESWNPFLGVGRTFRAHYTDAVSELKKSEAYGRQVSQFQENQKELKALKDRRALSSALVNGKVPLR